MDNILITGGAGYIGSHASKNLKQGGYNPITFDNLVTGWRDAVQFGPFVKGDLLFQEDLDRVFANWNPIAVMHFASLSEVGNSCLNPEIYWRNNVVGSLNLLQSMVKANCQYLVFSSTCSIYGENNEMVVNEDTPTNPINPYAASKRAIEDMITGFVEVHGLKVIRFRYFNVAGSDPEGKIGEFHRPETHLIPTVLETIKAEKGSIEIFGDDYPTADGTCIRDYIHVEDIVQAHILGLENLLGGCRGGGVYNLGNGKGYSVREVINSCLKITNKSVPVEVRNRRLGDVSSITNGSNKATLELGWKCQYPEINKIVKDAWNWAKYGSYKQ